MRSALALASLPLALAASAAAAQTPAPAPANFALPRAYAGAGYAQPEITQCTTAGALRRDCVVPAMTAGRYLIVAIGGATASGANATQTLSITLNGAPCAATAPAAFTGKEGLRIGCEVSLLTDQPLTVSAVYGVQNGAADPAGPKLVLRRQPWLGVLSASAVVIQAPKAQPPKK
jgi:opacity protein-like surface antigen